MGSLVFTHPWLLLFLLLLPLLFWKPRRSLRPLETDRLALWHKALERQGGGGRKARFFPRLLNSLLFTTLIVAAAGPKRPEIPGVHKLWQVFDASPSMSLRMGPGEETRWSRALAHATALSHRAPGPIPSQACRLLAARLAPMGDTPSLGPGPLPAQPGALLPFAAQADRETAIVFWGDGAGPSPWPSGGGTQLFLGGAPLGAVSNQGFRLARLEDPWPDKMLDLQFALVKKGPARLRLRRGEGAWAALPPLTQGKDGLLHLRIPREKGGHLEISLEAKDPFALDDRLLLQLRPPPRLRVSALPPDKGQVLVRFLRERCGVSQDSSLPALWEVQIRSGGRLPSTQRHSPGKPGAAPDRGVLLCLGTQVGGEQVFGPSRGGLDWERQDPLLKGLDLSGFVPSRLLRGKLPPGFRVLARLGKDPLLAVHEQRRILAFLGTLPKDGLFRQPFFPILCLRFLRLVLDDGGESHLAPLPPSIEYAKPGVLEAKAIPPGREVEDIRFFEPERPFAPKLALLAFALLGMVFLRLFFQKR